MIPKSRVLTFSFLASVAAGLFVAPLATAAEGPQPATGPTKVANAAVLQELPFNVAEDAIQLISAQLPTRNGW